MDLQRRAWSGQVEAEERAAIERALVEARGDVGVAAAALGVSRQTLSALLRHRPHWWPREELGPRAR